MLARYKKGGKEDIQSVQEPKTPFSFLITAYQSQDFIEECLDSIENQTYFKKNNEYEILLGIDACQDTLDKVIEINHKYRNLRVFMMKENKGTYVATNTLIDIAKYDNLLRFDADDIMLPNMIEKISEYVEDNDILRFGFISFKNSVEDNIITSFDKPAYGAIFIKKDILNKVGGYKDWKCSADWEILERINSNAKTTIIPNIVFYRRDHPNNLSNSPETSLKSETRRRYNRITKSYKKYGPKEFKINRVVNEYIEINVRERQIVQKYDNIEETTGVEIYDNEEREGNFKDNIKGWISNIFGKTTLNEHKNELYHNHNIIKENTPYNYFSIVIPTMWKSNKIFSALEIYEKSKYVGEIILIDNNPLEKPDLSKYKKIRYYTKGKNIYVNPSWNWGYSLSNYNLILANDDIIIYDLDNIFKKIKSLDYDIIGIDTLANKNGEIKIEDILEFPQRGYGCFMYIKKYIYIPEQLKIWRGDALLFNNSNKKGILKNINISADISKTINSNKTEFTKIARLDKKIYEELFLKSKELNILIRTSGRPNFYKNCIQSIKEVYNNANLYITIDNENDLEYVKKYTQGMNYNYYLINKDNINNICSKYSIERASFIYNYYFNIIRPFLNGWCIIIDDDDELLLKPNFEDNLNNIYLYKADIGKRVVPSPKNFGNPPVLNDISSLCILFHSSQMIDWKPQRGGDYDFISELYKKYNPIWNDSILSRSKIGGNKGLRNDLN
jgi:glycosyltransferase involved in cell wall biosynthesis